jgi:hypothetical protein
MYSKGIVNDIIGVDSDFFNWERIMLKELFIRRPKLSVTEIAETLFAKFFKEEVRLTFIRIKKDLKDGSQIVEKEKLVLIIISLFVFIINQATASVYGESKTRNKIQNTFYRLIEQEFKKYYSFIIELAEIFAVVYKKKPEDPLFGLGVCFSRCISKKNDYNLLTAMVVTTEVAKKYNKITKYFNQVNEEYRIS